MICLETNSITKIIKLSGALKHFIISLIINQSTLSFLYF